MGKFDSKRIEFHRTAIALMSEEKDSEPGTAFWIESPGHRLNYEYCTCETSKDSNCRHLKELGNVIAELKKDKESKLFNDKFRNSMWMNLASCMDEACRVSFHEVSIDAQSENSNLNSTHFFHNDRNLISCSGTLESVSTFIDRISLNKNENSLNYLSRADVLEALGKHTLNETETELLNMGRKTRRQALEESFWFRFAYHCFMEYDFEDKQLSAEIDIDNGKFSYTLSQPENDFTFNINVPSSSVKNTTAGLKNFIDNFHSVRTLENSLQSVIKMSMNEDNSLSMELYLRLKKDGDKDCLYKREEVEKNRFGDLIYLPDEKAFAVIEKNDSLIKKFKGKFKRIAKNEKIPELLDSFGETLWGRTGIDIVDDSVSNLKIFKEYDSVVLNPKPIDREWCSLSIEYRFGKSSISISDIIKARKKKKRFLETNNGWVDCYTLDIDGFTSIPGLKISEQIEKKEKSLKVSPADMLRIVAASKKSVSISEKSAHKEIFENLIQLKSSQPFPELPGMTSSLRNYQIVGAQWLTFLYENKFGGLLCDDMGLGKTHQVMALMLWLKDKKKIQEPFLVVAPVTVLSHWEAKIKIHTPDLEPVIYHGSDREFPKNLSGNQVILTSYGLLRKECKTLAAKRFSIVVFDEAQHLKNKKTQVYQAAQQIKGHMKLGVTGTPIENSIEELKALMDITFPGYLGSDDDFDFRYVKPVINNNDTKRREELTRVIKPFTLRRLKTTVLDELPAKIEDIRLCKLSDEQVGLYQEAISANNKYISTLKNDSTIPYIHIFALLTLLKQTCNHPALINKDILNYKNYSSGKWELFKEIIDEAVSSGQKTVVYTQYTGMVDIIHSYLKEEGIDSVKLTGASQNRGKIIDRFNNDPDCMVFTGSLLAGGTGIDLVAASVVIHYDRWWNAAKEDQATDRVHRIGQKRGVQVFKLVTTGTLEEKISAIIEKKRNLMDSIVREDDSKLLKTFSREQLIELLELPGL